MKSVIIINGPNLNLLGKREPDVYGSVSFDDFLSRLRAEFPDIQIDYFQSNIEGELINCIQESDGRYNGIILNAAGYSHTSVAIPDTVGAIATPVIGVHLSNIHRREEVRHTDLLASRCIGGIFGLGLESYRLAVQYFAL